MIVNAMSSVRTFSEVWGESEAGVVMLRDGFPGEDDPRWGEKRYVRTVEHVDPRIVRRAEPVIWSGTPGRPKLAKAKGRRR